MTDLDANDDFKVSVEFLLSWQGNNNTDDLSKVISMVPSWLRELSPKSFDPRVVSIGPLHHEDENLKGSEGLKKTYIRDLLSRLKLSSEETLEECLRTIYDSIPKIRECYVGMGSYNDVELARMMVTDACFILEFINKVSERNVLLAASIYVDLLLVENQIPLFVLKDIFNCTILKSPNYKKTSLTDHIRPILEFGKLFYSELKLSDDSTNHNHILGLLYACYRPKQEHDSFSSGYDPKTIPNVVELNKAGYDPNTIPNVVELDKAGVNFKPNKSDESWPMTMKVKSSWCTGWLSVFWDQPTLTMPKLLINEYTELKLRNLIAYEQKCDFHYVASYTMALDMIVDNEEDIAMLVKSKVMTNAVGSNEEAAKMVNNICKGVSINNFFYINQWKVIDMYYRNAFWRKSFAEFKRTYFNNPWNLIALLAGIMLFALTMVQTYFTAVQTCFSDSKK